MCLSKDQMGFTVYPRWGMPYWGMPSKISVKKPTRYSTTEDIQNKPDNGDNWSNKNLLKESSKEFVKKSELLRK